MKRFICLCLSCLLLTSSFFGHLKNKAYADPFTAAQIGGVAYALMQSWGIQFSATAASGVGMSNFMETQVTDYASSKGQSILEIFGDHILVDAVGKLVVGHQVYNACMDFVDWLKSRFVTNKLSEGELDGEPLPFEMQGNSTLPGGISFEFREQRNYSWGKPWGAVYAVYSDGTSSAITSCPNYCALSGKYSVSVYSPTKYYVVWDRVSYSTGNHYDYVSGTVSLKTGDISADNVLSWDNSGYIEPTVLNPNYGWAGDIGGVSAPDTNLDQLIGGIFDEVADNNLSVDGEVIDIPVPPEPVDPDTPLSDVPWGGLDDALTGIDTNIGDIYDSLHDGMGHDVIGELTGINSAVNELADAVGHDVIDAINEQTGVIEESSAATAEAVGDIAEALEDEAIDWQKFDLRGLFPFCIPFDIYNMLEALDASPTAPHVQLPFVIESIGFSYSIDLDFSDFDQVAAVMRTMELIVYGIALAWATSKVIKW